MYSSGILRDEDEVWLLGKPVTSLKSSRRKLNFNRRAWTNSSLRRKTLKEEFDEVRGAEKAVLVQRTRKCRRVNWGRLHEANFRGIESRRKCVEKAQDSHTLARVISCTMYPRTKRHLSPGKNIISCVQTLIAFAKINELLKFSCTVWRNVVTIAQFASRTRRPDVRLTTGRGRSTLANWENAGAFFNYGPRIFPQTCVFTKLISSKN